jgi:hypothetical protein
MGSVRLYAIAIDEVRDIFRASPETASALRAVAAERFAGSAPAMPGLLGKLGPVFRRQPDAPVVRPDVPSGSDADLLLCGRYVPPHRLAACWTLLETWLEHLSWGWTAQEVSESRLDEFDFDLVRCEVPARHALRNLLNSDLRIALMPCPGLAAGWARREHVESMAAAWRPAVTRLEPEHQPMAKDILSWLDGYHGWADAAVTAHRPPPDVVAVLRS